MTLHDLIIELRAILYGEAPSRLHANRTIDDPDHPDEGGLGRPFTAYFHRYIGHWSHWGQSRLGMSSIMEVSEWCGARHTGHQIPHAVPPVWTLCAQMVYEATYLGQEPADLAWLHDMELEQVDRMLTQALTHAREWRKRQESRPKEPRFDGPDPLPYERVVRSGLPRLEPTA